MKFDLDSSKLPQHIAIIMDGNGRWAKRRFLPRNLGHKAGVERLKNILNDIFDLGIKYVSIFAFSTENNLRPKEEVEGLYELLKENLCELTKTVSPKGIKISVMGDLSGFPQNLQVAIDETVIKTINNTGGVLNIGLNYGSRAEIIRAVNLAVKKGIEVDENSFKKLLYTESLPDPDLIIRTSGEMRLSNFMLYQAAYSELYFTTVLWPDFDKKELVKALKVYAGRNRRFGKV